MTSPTPQYADLIARLRGSYIIGRDKDGKPYDTLYEAADAIRDLQQRCKELERQLESWKVACDACDFDTGDEENPCMGHAMDAYCEEHLAHFKGLEQQIAEVLKLCDAGNVWFTPAAVRAILAPPRSDAEQEKPA